MSHDDETLTTQGGGARAEPAARPELVGRFVLERRLGHGGMGEVWAAFDPELDRRVAIKLLHRTAPDDATGEGRTSTLLTEAQALARLTHPNVVTVYDVGRADGNVYLAMELVDGTTLERDADAQQPWRQTLDTLLAIAEGLAAIHGAGLIHGDIKPANVMLGRDGRVRIVDLGIAVDARRASDRVARSGTPGFMAPELYEGAPPDPRSDQFAFCVTAHRVLHGHHPFEGDDAVSLAAAIHDGRRSRARGRAIPAWLRRAIDRGLAADPAGRHPSMQALAASLRGGIRRVRLRRLAMVVAGAGASAVVFATTQRVARARARAECSAQAQALPQAWQGQQRDALRAAFADTSVAAAEALSHALVRMDQFASDWGDTREQVCEAATVQRSLPPDLFQQAARCFDDAGAQFESLVDRLATGEVSTLRSAPVAAGRLPRLDECADPQRIARRPQPPREDAEAIDAIRRTLVRAKLTLTMGARDDAIREIEAAVDAAAAIGWPPLHAEALIQRGQALVMQGRYADAATAFEDAYFRAIDGEVPTLAALAAGNSVSTVGYHLGRPTEGRLWARLGEASAGSGDVAANASRDLGLGTIDFAAADYRRARDAFQRAADALAAAYGESYPDVAAALNNVAAADTELGDYDHAVEVAQRALRIREEAFGRHHPDVGQAYTTLGNVRMVGGHVELALQAHEHAEEILKAAYGEEHPWAVGTAVAVARDLEALRRFRDARSRLQWILATRERNLSPEHVDLAHALHNLGTIALQLGDDDEARRLLERARAIREAVLEPTHPDRWRTVLALAELAERRGERAEAEALAQRAVEGFERAANDTSLDLAIALRVLGGMVSRGGDIARADGILTRALTVLDAVGAPAATRAGFLVERADHELRAHDPVAARRHADEALGLADDSPAGRIAAADARAASAQALLASGDRGAEPAALLRAAIAQWSRDESAVVRAKAQATAAELERLQR